MKCLKPSPSLSARSTTGAFAEGRSVEGFSFSLSVILNLLHYSLQTLPEGSNECKHGGGGKDNGSDS